MTVSHASAPAGTIASVASRKSQITSDEAATEKVPAGKKSAPRSAAR
jgi:hypothetical protein